MLSPACAHGVFIEFRYRETCHMAPVHIILADDDPDECLIFTQVLKEVIPNGKITCVENCHALLDYLEKSDGGKDGKVQADLVFLDLNMPLVPGHECLKNSFKISSEIKYQSSFI